MTVWVLIIGMGTSLYLGMPKECVTGFSNWYTFTSSQGVVSYMEDFGVNTSTQTTRIIGNGKEWIASRNYGRIELKELP